MDKNVKAIISLENEVRKGPWTMEEDLILINYIANHGEGVWNSLARSAGLKRTGKSCRLRWLNYLRPDVLRGNISPEEELLIMELHAKWGNRWSKIAKHLPGRTDNEIKNYWRTRIQKHIKHHTQSSSNSRRSSSNQQQQQQQQQQQKLEQASSSQLSTASTTNNNNYENYTNMTNEHQQSYLPSMSSSSPSISYHDNHSANYMATTPPHINNMQMHNGTNNNEYNFWGTPEDLWSVQLFNGV